MAAPGNLAMRRAQEVVVDRRMSARRSRGAIAGGIGIGLLLSACATTTEPGAVGVERRQLLLVSSEDINQGAAIAYRQAIQQATAKGAVNRDPEQVERVRRVAQRVIPQTGVFRPDAPGWKWEVNVISSAQVNAWCMPGGKIAFYTGMLEKLRLTDDEAAAVLGHEIAHALREHGRERVSQQLATSTVLGVGAAILGVGGGVADLAALVTHVTFDLPNSRGQETEADRIGVELAARAGYDPRAAITLWQKMGAQDGGSPPQWLSTHPSNETRIRDLEDYVQRVLPLYEETRRGQ
jgi:predicted Zn-dependent protease